MMVDVEDLSGTGLRFEFGFDASGLEHPDFPGDVATSETGPATVSSKDVPEVRNDEVPELPAD